MSADSTEHFVAAFYRFAPLANEPAAARALLLEAGERRGVRGLVLLAAEGINATVSGSESSVREFVESAAQILGHQAYELKEARSTRPPFRRFSVQARDELITWDGGCFSPEPEDDASHLSPDEWDRMLGAEGGVTVLDVRNDYESRVGTFQGAITPPIRNFQELKRFLEQTPLPRDRPLLTFCTGGIRCEKALPELRARGFSQVYQLDGGILNYLAHHKDLEACGEGSPRNRFHGECFVFDHRVAVDHMLQPSVRYGLCPHCGDPADVSVCCLHCGAEAKVCDRCSGEDRKRTCSKNCRYHYGRAAHRNIVREAPCR
jgi:UPF0176 protein